MSSFVGKPEAPINDDLPRSGFWPGINMADYRSEVRVINSITSEQAEWSVVQALLSVIPQLQEYEDEQRSKGYMQLEDVPSPIIAGIKQNELLFKQAIFSKAKSLLLEKYSDVDMARKPGNDLTERDEKNIPILQAESFIAIRKLQGKTGVYAELV